MDGKACSISTPARKCLRKGILSRESEYAEVRETAITISVTDRAKINVLNIQIVKAGSVVKKLKYVIQKKKTGFLIQMC